MSLPPPHPPGVLTERAVLAAYPQLTLKSIKRGELAGTFPRRVKLPAGGHGWPEEEVRRAVTARDAPDAPDALSVRVPAGHVGLLGLIGMPRVSRCMARRAGDGKKSAPERQARPGLITLSEPQLREAIAEGSFPRPVTGPWGEAWLIDAVQRWRTTT